MIIKELPNLESTHSDEHNHEVKEIVLYEIPIYVMSEDIDN